MGGTGLLRQLGASARPWGLRWRRGGAGPGLRVEELGRQARGGPVPAEPLGAWGGPAGAGAAGGGCA